MLVTEWMDSPVSLATVIADGTQAERDHYGELLVRFLFAGPARTGMLHADPHPGNFRILPLPTAARAGSGVLDFGAVSRLPGGTLPAGDGPPDPDWPCSSDSDALLAGLRARGLRQGRHPRRPRRCCSTTWRRSSSRPG